MKTVWLARLVALASACGAAPLLAAQPTIDAALVSRLCPVTGAPGLMLGATVKDQPAGLLRSLRTQAAGLGPFDDVELDSTAWSDRVAAVTYRAAWAEGLDADLLDESFQHSVEAAGWNPVPQDRDLMPLAIMVSQMFEREVDGPAGKQKLLLEFAIDGALALRCGDRALLAQDKRELDGTLEPASPRPIAPPYDPTLRLPGEAACQSPALQKLMAGPGKLDEDAPELTEFAAASVQESDRAQHAKRLNTWLEWKLLGSGKVDDNRLVVLRERAAKQDVKAEMGQMLEFLAVGGELLQSRDAGDAQKSCESLRKMLIFNHDSSRRDSSYWDRVNAALEAEAKRLGIAVEQ